MHDILRNAQHKQETRLDDKSLMTSNGNNGPTMFCMQAVFSSARNLRLIGARRSELQEIFRRPYLPLAPLSADALATLHGQGVRRKAVGLAPALGTSKRSRLSRDISAPIYRVVVDVGLAYILCLTFLHRKSQPFFPILAVLASPRALSQPIALPDTRPPFAIPIFLRIASALVINAAADWRYDVAGACCARLLKKKILKRYVNMAAFHTAVCHSVRQRFATTDRKRHKRSAKIYVRAAFGLAVASGGLPTQPH